MKFKLFASLAMAFFIIGCSSKPSDADLNSVLVENIPSNLKPAVVIEQTKTEVAGNDDEVFVKFKAQLKLTQPLFEAANFEAAAKTSGGDLALFDELEKRARELSDRDRESAAPAIEAATAKALFLSDGSPTGATSEWYGSFKARKVMDKWLTSDFKTEIGPKFAGKLRTEFPESAIPVSRAGDWFSAVKTGQMALLGKIETKKLLDQKDVEIAQARSVAEQERQVSESLIAQARSVAEQERKVKESLIAANEKRARKMPLEVGVRRALVGNSLVLRMQATQAMTVHLNVVRGLQHHARDFQLRVNNGVDYGHLEGWGFKQGDSVTISHPSFDAFVLTVQ